VINDCQEFTLWLSPHILDNTERVLVAAGMSQSLAEKYVEVLADIAAASGGDVITPQRTVSDCSDYEDNLILDLAADMGAVIIVSDDTDLTSMSPWRATPILRPAEFAARVDAMRRARRR
jgi:putative PIN family toxin of toxin-antitoxin system